jgi:hypothetical protein
MIDLSLVVEVYISPLSGPGQPEGGDNHEGITIVGCRRRLIEAN